MISNKLEESIEEMNIREVIQIGEKELKEGKTKVLNSIVDLAKEEK